MRGQLTVLMREEDDGCVMRGHGLGLDADIVRSDYCSCGLPQQNDRAVA